jgi:hypothetical protein
MVKSGFVKVLKKIALISLALASFQGSVIAQDDFDVPMDMPVPPARNDVRWIIDTPTAYMLPRGAYDIDIRTFPDEGVEASLCIGLADRFSVGIAYSGEKILSEYSPEWNPKIDFKLRYKLIEETVRSPQVTIGFSSFGYGLYRDEQDSALGYVEKRYMVKSPGFYAVFSKKYPYYYNQVSFHSGINYSLENSNDSDPNIFMGFIVSLGYNMVFLSEYDFAINDNKKSGIFGTKGRGYLNIGAAWYITPDLSIELDMRNLLLNRRSLGDEKNAIDREVRLVYMQFFKD